jgi:hypothetical protein
MDADFHSAGLIDQLELLLELRARFQRFGDTIQSGLDEIQFALRILVPFQPMVRHIAEILEQGSQTASPSFAQ